MPSQDFAVAGPSMPQATPTDADSFTRAAAKIPEVQVQPPSAAQALGQDLTHRLEQLSTRLQTSFQPPAENAPVRDGVSASSEGGGAPKPTDVVGSAVSQMQAVYAFAIETTLVSRGSTETTKIFNTLLKGQ
ncbi:MAG: hypothetical protein ACRYHB_03510 [Janthinobacterium lividum]